MTTVEKLDYLKRHSGMSWGKIAESLGISRQMMDFVRCGKRVFNITVQKRLDELLLPFLEPQNKDVAKLNDVITTTPPPSEPSVPFSGGKCAECATLIQTNALLTQTNATLTQEAAALRKENAALRSQLSDPASKTPKTPREKSAAKSPSTPQHETAPTSSAGKSS